MATVVQASPIPINMNNSTNNKRKRGNEEMGRNIRNNPQAEENYASLLQSIDDPVHDDNTRTAQAALAGAMDHGGYPEHGSFDASGAMSSAFDDATAQNMAAPPNSNIYSTTGASNQTPGKPPVGSDEWHKTRKDSHKEVERRRREVINEGIENIAKIVPGVEKNKGAILQRTAQYITELQEQTSKFDQERATFDIALKELTSRNERLKTSVQQAWQESKKWQQRCRDAGLHFDDYDDGGLGLDDADFDAAAAS